jgi:purine/pyrimidine-nucleoside phosphorylase
MSAFKNVTIIREANVYFDGKVTSRTVLFEDGTKKTLGVMMPGDYEFGTEAKELMEVLGGKMIVKLKDEIEWVSYEKGDSFEVPAHSSFKLQIPEVADYCCSYLAD